MNEIKYFLLSNSLMSPLFIMLSGEMAGFLMFLGGSKARGYFLVGLGLWFVYFDAF